MRNRPRRHDERNARVPDKDPILWNDDPLDDTTPESQRWLAKLQGNILKAHGRNRGVYIFFAFGDQPVAVRRTLARLAREYVTSALTQHREAAAFAADNGKPGGLFGNLFVSAGGYRRLGEDPVALFPEKDDNEEALSTFSAGLKAHAEQELGDPPPATWEPGYRDPIDAMLLLADDDATRLKDGTQKALDLIRRANIVRAIEVGEVLRNDNGDPIEHFGYVDGRSQPLYLKSDFRYDPADPSTRVAERKGGPLAHWDPFEPLRRVLLHDPCMPHDPECYGSKLVFRKLEQDVDGFRQCEQDLASALALKGESRALAGAMAVGRFRDGTPVTMSTVAGRQFAEQNDFQFGNDAAGDQCPFHAHIRKVNPRGDVLRRRPSLRAQAERQRRITRRGITYGVETDAGSPLLTPPASATREVGLLFMCFQADIRRQFAFIQRSWCNKSSFVRDGVGLDPVIGQRCGEGHPDQQWPSANGNGSRVSFRFESFVRMKGGEFFFAPSVPWLQSLAKEET